MKVLKKIFSFFSKTHSENVSSKIPVDSVSQVQSMQNPPVNISVEKIMSQPKDILKTAVGHGHTENESVNSLNKTIPTLQFPNREKLEEMDRFWKMIQESDKNQKSIFNSSEKPLDLYDISKLNLKYDYLPDYKIPKIDDGILSKPPSDKGVMNR